jgi:hypothetical protein
VFKLRLSVSFKGRMLCIRNAVNAPPWSNNISNAVDAPRVATQTVFALAGLPPEGLVRVVRNIIHGDPGFEIICVHNLLLGIS